MYKASVIIPVYNAEKTLRRCVESIVYGRERDVEVILVDDCSSDHSWALCNQLSQENCNVKCVQNKENSGVSYTRNHGLNLAQGEFLLFVDSDDWVSGAYVSKLLQLAKNFPNMLVICGYLFIDEINDIRRNYVFEAKGENVSGIQAEHFFDLSTRALLQLVWNKAFRRNVIEQHYLRFDESQNMGEDFQFVLDYMEAAQVTQCVVLNETLYYYIRATSSSLMSKFGLTDNNQDIRRLQKLLRLTGADKPENQKSYERAVESMKTNAVYHIIRSKNNTKAEKLANIERVMQDGQPERHYRQQKRILRKEQLSADCRTLKKLVPRIRGKIQRWKNDKTISKVRQTIKEKDFTIISQNCIGGVLYHDMGLQFLSPTINLFIPQPDFVKFVLNLEHYLNADLRMYWDEEWPIGILGDDVRIEFMHYSSCTEAKAKWEERKKRVNFDRILVLSTDRDGFTEQVFSEWKKITYPKVLFTVKDAFCNDSSTVLYPAYFANGFVADLIPKREFYKDGILLSVLNSFTEQGVKKWN